MHGRGSEKTGDVNPCHPQTADSSGKTEDSQDALQKALQIDPAALLAAIGNLTAEQRAEILKALGVQL